METLHRLWSDKDQVEVTAFCKTCREDDPIRQASLPKVLTSPLSDIAIAKRAVTDHITQFPGHDARYFEHATNLTEALI